MTRFNEPAVELANVQLGPAVVIRLNNANAVAATCRECEQGRTLDKGSDTHLGQEKLYRVEQDTQKRKPKERKFGLNELKEGG